VWYFFGDISFPPNQSKKTFVKKFNLETKSKEKHRIMKFGEEIERAIFSEWRAYYFDYGGIKKILKEAWEQFPYKELFEHHEIFIENDPDPRYAFQFLIIAASFKRFNVHSTGALLSPASLSSLSVSPGTPQVRSNTRPGTPHHSNTSAAISHDHQHFAHRDYLMAALERFFTIHSEYDEDHPFPADPTIPHRFLPPNPSAPTSMITASSEKGQGAHQQDGVEMKEREGVERENSNSSCGDGGALNNHQVGLLEAVADAITLNTDIRRHVQTTTSGDKSKKNSKKSKVATATQLNATRNMSVILEGESIDYNSSNVVAGGSGVGGAAATTFAASRGRAVLGRYIVHSVLEARSSHDDDASSHPQRHSSRTTRRGSVISISSGQSGGGGDNNKSDCGTDDNNDAQGGGDVSGGDTAEPSSPMPMEEDERQVLLLTTVALPASMRTRREELRQQSETLTQRVNVNCQVSDAGDATPLHGQQEDYHDLCVSIHPEMVETICGMLSNFTLRSDPSHNNNNRGVPDQPVPTEVAPSFLGESIERAASSMSSATTAAFKPPSATTDSTVSSPTTALSRRRSSYMSEALGNNAWQMTAIPSRFLSGLARMESPYIAVRTGAGNSSGRGH
jgi:hypothetical protein